MRRTRIEDSLRCSFCHKGQNTVSKLLSSPSDYPRAYICDECVSVCASIIEDEREHPEPETVQDDSSEDPHPLLSHPLASRFLRSVERWIQQESLGVDASEAFAEMRSLARRMMG